MVLWCAMNTQHAVLVADQQSLARQKSPAWTSSSWQTSSAGHSSTVNLLFLATELEQQTWSTIQHVHLCSSSSASVEHVECLLSTYRHNNI